MWIFSVPVSLHSSSSLMLVASASLGLLSLVSSLGFFSFGLVDRVFCLCCWRCPIVVAIDFGKCFRMFSDVNPGKDDRNPRSAALIIVDGAGLYMHACKYAICSATVAVAIPLMVICGRSSPTMLQARSKMLSSLNPSSVSISVRSTIHSPFDGTRRPTMIISFSLLYTSTLSIRNKTWHPVSQSCPTDTRE